MLRDLPPLGPRISASDEQLFMNNAHDPANDAPIDPLDDVFGSAPSSPVHATGDREGSNGGVIAGAEHSDIPRLRSIHVTNGYREGIAVSKEKHIQAGFDEGYGLGGEIGLRVGYYLGVLEGVWQAVSRLDREKHAGLIGEVKRVFEDGKEELNMERLLSPEYFGADGVWLYEVPGQDEEGSELRVGFGDVAERHPVLVVWKERVEGVCGRVGLKLG